MRRLNAKECAVLVVDVQERLAAAMPPPQMEEFTRAATVLLEAASLLGARGRGRVRTFTSPGEDVDVLPPGRGRVLG